MPKPGPAKKDKKKRNPRRQDHGPKPYQQVQVPKVKELLPVYQAALAIADKNLSPALCAEPWPMMAAVIGVLTASEESPHLPDASKT